MQVVAEKSSSAERTASGHDLPYYSTSADGDLSTDRTDVPSTHNTQARFDRFHVGRCMFNAGSCKLYVNI